MAKVILKHVPAGNYTKVHNEVIRSGFLNPGEKAVFMYLVSLPPEASVTHEDMATALGVSRTTVRGYVDGMREKRIIKATYSGGGRGRTYISSYTIETDPGRWEGPESVQGSTSSWSKEVTESDQSLTRINSLPPSEGTESVRSSGQDLTRNCSKEWSESDHVYKTISKTDMKTNSLSSSSSENSDPSESPRPDTTPEGFHTSWDSLMAYTRVGNPSTCKEIYSQLVSEGNDPMDIAEGVAAVAESFEGDEKYRPGLKKVLESGQWEKALAGAKKKKDKVRECEDVEAGIERAIRRQAGLE